jgi:hypothetical protein
MITFYRARDIVITAEAIESFDGSTRRLSELHGIGRLVTREGWRRRRIYELRAVHRGREIVLYRTADRIVYGQVTRALVRALEGEQRGSPA